MLVNHENNIHCFQTDTAWEDPIANFEVITRQVDELRPREGSLLIFPELCTTGFSMDVETIAEPSEGPSWRFFSDLARRYSTYIVAGIPSRDSSGLGINEAVTFAPDGNEVSRYQKVHLFPLCNEGDFYTPGTGPMVFQWGDWKVAPFICYDLRFPELFRAAVKNGAEALVVIANWPAAREMHWLALLKARAIENQAYVVGVNRCGDDPNLTYSGASLIVSPTGDVIAQAGNSTEVLSATLEKASLLDWRTTFPALNDMRLLI